MNTFFKLIPKTLRGKNKLQNKVNLWKQIDTGATQHGKISIQEVNPSKSQPDIRWVCLANDPDFSLEKVTPP